jgi:hypothetical protein
MLQQFTGLGQSLTGRDPEAVITSLRRYYQHHEIDKCMGRSESVVSLGLQP